MFYISFRVSSFRLYHGSWYLSFWMDLVVIIGKEEGLWLMSELGNGRSRNRSDRLNNWTRRDKRPLKYHWNRSDRLNKPSPMTLVLREDVELLLGLVLGVEDLHLLIYEVVEAL